MRKEGKNVCCMAKRHFVLLHTFFSIPPDFRAIDMINENEFHFSSPRGQSPPPPPRAGPGVQSVNPVF